MGVSTMFDRMQEQPAKVFKAGGVLRKAEASGELSHTYLEFSPRFLSIYAHKALLIRQYAYKESILTH